MFPQHTHAVGLLLVVLAFVPGVSSEPISGPDPCDSVAIQTSLGDCGEATDDPVSCWAPAIWPPRSSTCRVGPVEVHCDNEWTFVDPGLWVPTGVDCQVTDPPAGVPVPHCDPILDTSETEVGVSCVVQNVNCTQAIWGIHEDWITLGGSNGCHAMVRFNGEAFQDRDPVDDRLFESCSAMVEVTFFNGASACDLHWLACQTGGSTCPPPPQPLPVPDCHQTLQYPPSSSECQVGSVSVDCTSQWTTVGGLFVPEHYECTATEDDTGLGLSCAAFTDDDGWRGYDCTVHGVICHQALWGIHEDDLVVGGYNGCNVVVKTNIV